MNKHISLINKFIIGLALILFVNPLVTIESHATTTSTPTTIYSYGSQRAKVGSDYYWIDLNRGLLKSKSKTGSGSVIVKYQGYGLSAVISGKNIYYGISKGTKLALYKCNNNGKNKKLLKRVKTPYGGTLAGFYGNSIYYTASSSVASPLTIHTYRYDIKKKKKHRVASNLVLNQVNGRYFVGTYNSGDLHPMPLKVYNAKSKKLKTIDKKMMGYKVHKNTVYFAHINSISSNFNLKFTLKKYNLKTGKTSSIAKKTFKGSYASVGMTNKYAVYQGTNGKYYKYTYKTKKTTVVSSHQYNNTSSY